MRGVGKIFFGWSTPRQQGGYTMAKPPFTLSTCPVT